MSRRLLKFGRAAIAQGGMQTMAIVPNLDELEDGGLRFGFGFKGVVGALLSLMWHTKKVKDPCGEMGCYTQYRGLSGKVHWQGSVGKRRCA